MHSWRRGFPVSKDGDAVQPWPIPLMTSVYYVKWIAIGVSWTYKFTRFRTSVLTRPVKESFV